MTKTQQMDHYYNNLIIIVNQSLESVLGKASATNGSVDLDKAIASAKTLLEELRDRTEKDIRELRELSEWKTFVISFYGETNAGKSTLIEVLRILLGEEGKRATQQEFKTLAKALRVDPRNLATLEQSIKKLELKLIESKSRAGILDKTIQSEARQQHLQLEALKEAIEHKRESFNLWQKLVHLFRKLDEEKALSALATQVIQLKAKSKIEQESIAAEIAEMNSELSSQLADRAQLEASFAKMVPLQDGIIIGNGSSDFTVESRSYEFTATNGQNFRFLDVPGIEGDEKKVMSTIEASVKTTHAVFYVTRTATPPGSGSEGQEGTIDKIKRQLGKQTEVWAIYNKSATSPHILQNDTLINDNDSIGLTDMHKALTSTLGAETYKGHMCLSAMPAFFASASCLLPNNPHVKGREKFLSAMSEAEIMKSSGVEAFIKFIREEICQNFKEKIRVSNLKKLVICMEDGINRLREARDKFDEAAKKLAVQHKSVSSQIDQLSTSTSKKLVRECRDQLSSTKSDMRKSVYDYIDSDKSNDDFKAYLTSKINELKTSIGQVLEMRFTNVYEVFKQQAAEIIKQNQKNTEEILHYTIEDPFSSMKLRFNTDFKMDNGISVAGLLSTLGGAATLIWASFLASSPVGWTAAAVLTAVGLVFSFYKAVRSFFSSDYKKEQQRNSTDDNLEKVFAKLTEMLNENLDAASVKINEALLHTKNQMRIPYDQSVNTRAALEAIASKMMELRDRLNSNNAFEVTTSNTTRRAAAAAAA